MLPGWLISFLLLAYFNFKHLTHDLSDVYCGYSLPSPLVSNDADNRLRIIHRTRLLSSLLKIGVHDEFPIFSLQRGHQEIRQLLRRFLYVLTLIFSYSLVYVSNSENHIISRPSVHSYSTYVWLLYLVCYLFFCPISPRSKSLGCAPGVSSTWKAMRSRAIRVLIFATNSLPVVWDTGYHSNGRQKQFHLHSV